MNLNKLEKELKNFRTSSQEKIDTNQLWNRVQPHVKPRKKGHWRISFFIGSLLLLMSVIGFWLSPSSDQQTQIAEDSRQTSELEFTQSRADSENKIGNKKEEQISSINLKSNLAEQNSENSRREFIVNRANGLTDEKRPVTNTEENNDGQGRLIDTRTQLENPQGLVKNETLEKQFSSPNFNETNEPIQIGTTTLSESGKLNRDVVEHHQAEFNAVQKIEATTSHLNLETDNSSGTALDDEASMIPLNGQKGFASDSSDQNNESNSINLRLENVAPQNINQHTIISSDLKSNSNSALSNSAISISAIPKLMSLLDIDNIMPMHYPKRISPYMRKSFPKLTFEIGGSYLAPNREFTLQQNEFENEFTSRELAEEVLEGWYASASVRYNVTPRWGINVGMHYGAINERSSKTLSYSETIFLQDTIIGNLVRVDGSIDPIYGDIEIDRTVTKNVSRINSYSFLQLPIEVIYTHPVNRLNVEFGVGAIQSIRLSSSGFWHPDDKSEYDLVTDSNGYLKSNLGLGLTGRMGIGYDITPGLGLYVHGRYINYLTGLTSSNYGIEQKYNLLGVELGARLHLFN